MLGVHVPSPAAAAVNLYDATLGDGLADLRRMPAALIDEGPQRRVHRYLPVVDRRADAPPVLLVPPLAAPATCFDLRRGCSLAEHLLRRGRATYVVDYGSVSFNDRSLGLEHWIDDVVPGAVRAVAHDAGDRPVQLVGWCLGGILALLALCATPGSRSRSAALVASPFDFRQVPLLAPLRPIDAVTRGALVTGLYRVLGGAPAPLVQRVYQLAGIDKYVMKPWTMLSHADDRELLAQIEAVDAFMGDMTAYPGELRPALPPLLPRERPRRRAAGAGRPDARPRRRARAGAGDRRPGRRDRAGRRVPPPRRAPARRPGGPAADGAGRTPRRAHRACGADDDVAAARRVPRGRARAPGPRAAPARGRVNARVQRSRGGRGLATLTSPCAAPSPSPS